MVWWAGAAVPGKISDSQLGSYAILVADVRIFGNTYNTEGRHRSCRRYITRVQKIHNTHTMEGHGRQSTGRCRKRRSAIERSDDSRYITRIGRRTRAAGRHGFARLVVLTPAWLGLSCRRVLTWQVCDKCQMLDDWAVRLQHTRVAVQQRLRTAGGWAPGQAAGWA